MIDREGLSITGSLFDLSEVNLFLVEVDRSLDVHQKEEADDHYDCDEQHHEDPGQGVRVQVVSNDLRSILDCARGREDGEGD